MDNIEKNATQKPMELMGSKTKNIDEVNKIITDKVNETDNVKSAIDLLTTKTALQQEGVVEKLVDEKEQELVKNAETKKLRAETEKLKEEKEKEIAEFDKIIYAKQKEIDQLKVEADKSQAFFNSNKDILKYIGVREKKSLKTMQVLMFPATLVFIFVQILIFPITLCGLVLEAVIGILGGICGAIKNQALKIVITILVLLVIAGVSFCAYYFGGNLIKTNL